MLRIKDVFATEQAEATEDGKIELPNNYSMELLDKADNSYVISIGLGTYEEITNIISMINDTTGEV